MEALLVSTGIVAIAEIGDKTQLLSFVLAARYRKPIPIVLGILVATLLNHGIAGAAGAWITQVLGAQTLRWVLGLSFLAMAIWALVPDELGSRETAPLGRFGVFGASLIAFFIVEIGDKTQVATIALAANYSAFTAVVAGTTLGMMIANVPAVLIGDRLAGRLPVRLMNRVAAILFAALGAFVLWGGESFFG